MPRRNLLILFLVVLIAVLCRERVQSNPYGRVLANAMNRIERNSLDPVGELKLFEGAMDGMLGQLDDYSTYISPRDLPEFQEIVDLQFAGVGIEVAIDPTTKQLMVLSPVQNSPAARAGILAGDRILRIGKTSTAGMSFNDALVLLRGKKGEPVMLTILHEGETKSQEIEIVREIVQMESVLGDTRNADGTWNFFLAGYDHIGYIRINSFTDATIIELRQTLASMTQEGMRGLVLDLRDNPGGYLDAAVNVCDLLIDSGVIVTTRRREGRISKTCSATGDAPFANFPIAVVINQNSASAAEIVAACLQDHKRAVIVGQRSYGKGTVQEMIHLEQGCGAMKLTTSSYWRPSGKNIQRPRNATDKDNWGVSPDKGCKVVFTNDEFTQWQLWRARRNVNQPVDAKAPAKNGEKQKPFVDRQRLRAIECVEKEAASENRTSKAE